MTSIVYLGYPAESSSLPQWVEGCCAQEQKSGDAYPYMFYISGGAVTPRLHEYLGGLKVPSIAHRLCSKLAVGSTSARFVDPLVSADFESLYSMVSESPKSSEFRVLFDLYVLSRSSLLVLDTDMVGYGRGGMEAAYAHGIIPTLGVSDSPLVDPWYKIHLDFLVKSSAVLSSFPTFISDP